MNSIHHNPEFELKKQIRRQYWIVGSFSHPHLRNFYCENKLVTQGEYHISLL